MNKLAKGEYFRKSWRTKRILKFAKKALLRFNELYDKGFIKKQLDKTRRGEVSQEWLIKNDHLVDLYGDILSSQILKC